MKKCILLLLVGISIAGRSQVLPEDEFTNMVRQAQDQCQGAHESVVRSINEEFGTSIWGKRIRMNEADIVRFIQRTSGEKVSAGVDLTNLTKDKWVYEYDQKTASELMAGKGINVTTSYNSLWIKANQPMVYAEHEKEGRKIILELYCPTQEVLLKLRTGKKQSIEFLVTGYRGSTTGNDKIFGILIQVNDEKQVVKCANGHEFDKALGYKFCPTCGEPLE
jgi:hypothetical protein